MPRVIRLFQVKNFIDEAQSAKIIRKLCSLDGIINAQADASSGVIEIEYENALIDRYVIQEELSKIGFDMLI